jgi:hypothetical protein
MPRITATAAKIALALSAVALCTTAASAVSGRVQSACASDFMAYCSQHDPDGPGARKCMRVNGPRLSQACLNALIAAGEVSKAEVARRSTGK